MEREREAGAMYMTERGEMWSGQGMPKLEVENPAAAVVPIFSRLSFRNGNRERRRGIGRRKQRFRRFCEGVLSLVSQQEETNRNSESRKLTR